jgi:Tryptophan-associated transmembrane protein (Trp_oprn_chp)
VAEPAAGRPDAADPGRRPPGPGGAGMPPGAGPGEAAGGRRSLQVALVAVLGGVGLAAVGAGRPWALASAAVSLPGLGRAPLGAAELTGNDLAPLGGLALLGLVLLVGVAVTRGRGRWAVGLALLALGAALAVQAVAGAAGVRAEAEARARRGELEGVPAGAGVQVAARPAGPAMVVAGGLLLAAAGAEALRRGPRWPALGEAFRAPPDRAPPAPAGDGEPPWQGD